MCTQQLREASTKTSTAGCGGPQARRQRQPQGGLLSLDPFPLTHPLTHSLTHSL